MSTVWTSDPATWPPREQRHLEHWKVERALREELLASTPENRDDVFRDVYNRLFQDVPWHEANDPDPVREEAEEDLFFDLFSSLVDPRDTLLDLGCGDGSLVRRFSGAVRRCIGIDASDAMIRFCEENAPPNAEFLCASIIDVPVPEGTVDIAMSRQVVEHLHPDDMPAHLAAVLRCLRPGGRFLIETPSRLTGPWDVSRKFSETPTGFHLREYTNGELAGMLRDAGFRRVTSPAVPSRLQARLGRWSAHAYLPASAKGAVERVAERLPRSGRVRVATAAMARSVVLVGERPG
jgi:SAM-dependent methyltransferase